MCGIAAIFCQNKLIEDLQLVIKKMLTLVKNRGPDDEGSVLFNHYKSISVFGGDDTPASVFELNSPYCPNRKTLSSDSKACAALGHRRLSIIDLSPAGHQPMCTPDSRYWISYNGEVYNYLEIRSELESLGVKFKTKTDTEVILNAFVRWGKECLHHFNGMFAFIIYDNLEKKIFAARDRFGVKPLYYWRSSEGIIAFASEIKQFTVVPGWIATLNHQRTYDFLNWSLTDHTEDTLFHGVKQLLGGHFIEMDLDDKMIFPQRWYTLSAQIHNDSFDESTIKFHDLFIDAIKLRLRADVPIGSCLSGGLDSSSIVCTMHELLKVQNSVGNQKTFSSCSYEKAFDEREYIDLVIDKCGIDAHYIYPNEDGLLDSLSDIIWQQDEPFVSTSVFAQRSVFSLAKKHGVSVVLDGQGADEQLAGYHSFFGYKYLELFRNLQWIKLFKDIQRAKNSHAKHQGILLLINRLLPEKARSFFLKFFYKPTEACDWINFSHLNAICIHPFQNKPFDIPSFSQQQILNTNLPMLLRYEDRNSMSHSIEARTPFLDYRLVEYSLGLNSDHKIDGEWTKKILRESMKNYLPDAIRQRKDKMGFVTPEEHWIKSNPHIFKGLLEKALESSSGILNNNLFSLYEKMISGKIPFNQTPWKIICFGKWLDIFNVKMQ